MAIWTEEIEEQLIAMIQERPPLYDITEKRYANRVVKTELWQEIEAKLLISVKELKKRWDSLRTQYTRYRKLAPSGSAGAMKTGRQQWILTQLQFLEPHTKRKDTTSNLEPSTVADLPSSDACATTSESCATTSPEEPGETDSRPSSPLAESTICGVSSPLPSTSRMSTPRPRVKRGRKELEESCNESTSLMRSIGKTLEKMTQDDRDDAISAYCRNIEHRMRQLPQNVLPFFQHEVDNLLFKYLVDRRQTETSDTDLTLL